MTKQEERNKRFDEKFLTYKSWSTSEKGISAKVSPEELKSFLNSEVDLAIAEERKRILSGIANLQPSLQGHMAYTAVERIISLINKDN